MELKSGYTTGTCATLATKAVLKMIFEKRIVKSESIITPNNTKIDAGVLYCEFSDIYGKCAVKKYSGDDPDVTNGMLIFSEVFLTKNKEIEIDGGKGVGRVTKKGLQQSVGQAAINKVPRKMIENICLEMFDEYGFDGGAKVIISVPDGEKVALKTFNPRLGIDGGISILGTSGIVEPMSEKAIIDTIKTELSVKRANDGEYVMIAPGNYGIDFIRESFDVDLNKAVKCSNFIGEALDFSVKNEFKGILLIGHIGKFIKLAGGIMNTHSKNADSRIEIMAANTAIVCDDIKIVKEIMKCITTDDALDILKENKMIEKVMEKIIEKAEFYVNNRTNGKTEIGILMFSNVYGILGKTKNVDKLFKKFKEVEK